MGVIGNLHLVRPAIGGSWAKERAGGAFAAGLAFILIELFDWFNLLVLLQILLLI